MREMYCLIEGGVDAIELRKTHQITAHQHLQLSTLHFALLLVTSIPRLDADPESIHLNEVSKNAVHAVIHITSIFSKMHVDGENYVS